MDGSQKATHVLIDIASATVLFELYAVHVKGKRRGSKKCRQMVENVLAQSYKAHVKPPPQAPELPDPMQEEAAPAMSD
jgi:hypothetical protein